MDSSKLADRLRGILKTPTSRAEILPSEKTSPAIEEVLGGAWEGEDGRRAFVVERRAGPDEFCGRLMVRELAARHARAGACAPLLAPGPPGAKAPLVFLDLETTGLSGGAGTYAFLVGLGRFDDAGGFVTRQYLLVGFAGEQTLLAALSLELADAGAIVSFNGKSFDAPVLDTRYLLHRLENPVARLHHLDALHPARRFWSDETATCALTTLERKVLGARRRDDVPGFEIPGRYFQFVRSGDCRPLAAVLEHNRRDLLSLAGLTARLFELVEDGPETVQDGQEALALGRVYDRGSLDARARECFQLALVMDASAAVQRASLRHLAVSARRGRRFAEAAAYWQSLLEMPGCTPELKREANEALAIHHEHRVRDLARARTFALKSLEMNSRPAWAHAVNHRLARIERKMERGPEPLLLAY
jgi:uncharacterized protein